MVHDRRYYLIDVYRHRLNYPALKAKAIEYARLHDATRIYIEDTGVGTGLIAELQDEGIPAIGATPESNKIARMSIQSAKFESGLVYIPRAAHWLAVFEMELFAFPGTRHDDQVDSISQGLAHAADTGYDWTMSWVE